MCRSVWLAYREEPSFNVLYQSPLGNVPGALAGLLLAHLHHALLDLDVQLPRYKVTAAYLRRGTRTVITTPTQNDQY